MSSITCPKCKGLKRILGMGLLEKDCAHCNKTGRVLAPESVTETVSDNSDSKLRTDLRTLSDAYTDTQAENEKLKAQLAELTAKKKEPKTKSMGKGK